MNENQYRAKETRMSYVIMGDVTEYNSGSTQRNIENKFVTWERRD
jgi:hypothetical protein